jgi:hypothetical protein
MCRKLLLVILILTLMVSLGGLIGCKGNGIVGTYVNEYFPDERLELKKDGVFSLESEIGRATIEGNWETKDTEITFYSVRGIRGHSSFKGEIREGKIYARLGYDGSQRVWVKK